MSTTALQLAGIHRHYGDVRAVDGVDLAVRQGERFALLGPSGSGKTTILRLIAGFEQPDGGQILLGGVDVAGMPPEQRNVGVVFQDYALFPHRSVTRNIEFGLRMRGMSRELRSARVAEMLELVGLRPEASRRPAQLSGGQRQRVALARALAPNPSLLLLDEPLANLDRRLRETLRDELTAITSAVGVTTILVTHDQEEALSFADRVGVLESGSLAQVGSPSEVWRTPVNRFVATFLGDMNLLPATADGTQVRVAGLPQTTAVIGDRPSGAAVACLRPEALAVSADSQGEGVVESVMYSGGSATYRVQCGDVHLLVREAQPDGVPTISVGDRVAVRSLVDAVRLLPV